MLIRIVIVASFVLYLVFVISQAHAHQAISGWTYPTSCCSNNDCQQIPESAVEITSGGYIVTLSPGQHKQIKKKTWTFTIPMNKARTPPDGYYHICLGGEILDAETPRVICFYAPPMSY